MEKDTQAKTQWDSQWEALMSHAATSTSTTAFTTPVLQLVREYLEQDATPTKENIHFEDNSLETLNALLQGGELTWMASHLESLKSRLSCLVPHSPDSSPNDPNRLPLSFELHQELVEFLVDVQDGISKLDQSQAHFKTLGQLQDLLDVRQIALFSYDAFIELIDIW